MPSTGAVRCPESAGEPVELKDVLRGIPDERRRDVINAYWTAARGAAEYQVLVSASEMLESLTAAAASRASQPLGKHQGRHPHRLRLAARARLVDGEAKLIEAQFEARPPRWTQRTVHRTPPLHHAARRAVSLEARSRQPESSPAPGRCSAWPPPCQPWVKTSSGARPPSGRGRRPRGAAAAQDWQTGQRSLVELLALVDQQTAENLAFLDTLTQYNEAIADYACASSRPLCLATASLPASSWPSNRMIRRSDFPKSDLFTCSAQLFSSSFSCSPVLPASRPLRFQI